MRKLLFAALFAVGGLAGCAGDTATYHNALTGQSCTPNDTFVPMPQASGNGGHNSPTGIPGDNIDDPHSGKVDCYYDGNSGQGDDKKHPCAPGCDNQHCCVDLDGGCHGDHGDGGSGSGTGSGSGSGSGTDVPNPL